MRTVNNMRYFSLLGTLSMLGACSHMPQASLHDPEYRPVIAPLVEQPASHIESPSGSIYNPATNRFLFEDYRARRVGDILTVILEEKNQRGQKSQHRNRQKHQHRNAGTQAVWSRYQHLGAECS